jgi:hypothetical protein
VAGHIFQARPVWICTQSSITNINSYTVLPRTERHKHVKQSFITRSSEIYTTFNFVLLTF